MSKDSSPHTSLDTRTKRQVPLVWFAVHGKVDENGKIHRLRRECPSEQCGAGVFMAAMEDRHYCGKCGFTLVFSKPEDNGYFHSRDILKTRIIITSVHSKLEWMRIQVESHLVSLSTSGQYHNTVPSLKFFTGCFRRHNIFSWQFPSESLCRCRLLCECVL
uniref:Small ribosomal subunit protein eS31 domain-containing protein n=1 Tax=Timema cristinae TaxID=61476 RepID=A0A7R9CLT2_TIMCR|nr:unnamed protein product [Timema cristinae]